jgi:hypothetical protein
MRLVTLMNVGQSVRDLNNYVWECLLLDSFFPNVAFTRRYYKP